MSKLLITPVKESGFEPFVVEGLFIKRYLSSGIIYYINGDSYPEKIVTELED